MDWQNLPTELLQEIYRYLPTRDLLAISMVCCRWRDALDCVVLWENMVVKIDADLNEPSTVQLGRDYCKYLKNLELGWSCVQNRWLPYYHREITKKAVRFILSLDRYFVQITSIKLFNWHQINLKKIIITRAHLNNLYFVEVLESCLHLRDSLECLDIQDDFYLSRPHHNDVSLRFLNCIMQFRHLDTIKSDYYVLSRGVLYAIIGSQNANLRTLEIVVYEVFEEMFRIVDWVCLIEMSPSLEVTFILKNNVDDEIAIIILLLKKHVPLRQFSVVTYKQRYQITKFCTSLL